MSMAERSEGGRARAPRDSAAAAAREAEEHRPESGRSVAVFLACVLSAAGEFSVKYLIARGLQLASVPSPDSRRTNARRGSMLVNKGSRARGRQNLHAQLV